MLTHIGLVLPLCSRKCNQKSDEYFENFMLTAIITLNDLPQYVLRDNQFDDKSMID